MPNSFKVNSRFNSLLSEPNKKKTPPSPKRYVDRSSFRGNRYYEQDNDFTESIKIKREKKKLEEQLNIENFPSLGGNEIKKEDIFQDSFIDKITKENIFINENKLEPGWIELPKAYRKKKQDIKKISPLNIDQEITPDTINHIMDNLCFNYESYVFHFIKKWGDEEYEKLYLFPNYDYTEYDSEDEEKDSTDEDDY
jgi:hypothetical protein